jgi:biotin carboxyl carrier protein
VNGSVLIHAPADGCVVYAPPPIPAGELEVFDSGDLLARIENGGEASAVAAPARGFVFRRLVPEGVDVAAGTPLLVFRSV